jgi:enolase
VIRRSGPGSLRNLRTAGLGDEGGFAPEISEPEEALRLLVGAISDAGYTPGGHGVSVALDPAASEFRQGDDRYRVAGDLLDSGQMIDRLAAITRHFPVHLIEDGLGEDDDEGWIALTQRLGGTTELVGDDIFCTNPAIIADAIERGIGNASLIKLNQIGTVTETLEAMAICRRAGYRQFVSHRSGETEDSFIADLAVGTGCGHLKTGAPAPRRADRQIQPAARDRHRDARLTLRHELTCRDSRHRYMLAVPASSSKTSA